MRGPLEDAGLSFFECLCVILYQGWLLHPSCISLGETQPPTDLDSLHTLLGEPPYNIYTIRCKQSPGCCSPLCRTSNFWVMRTARQQVLRVWGVVLFITAPGCSSREGRKVADNFLRTVDECLNKKRGGRKKGRRGRFFVACADAVLFTAVLLVFRLAGRFWRETFQRRSGISG